MTLPILYTTTDLVKMFKAESNDHPTRMVTHWVRKGWLKPTCKVKSEYRYTEDAVKALLRKLEGRAA